MEISTMSQLYALYDKKNGKIIQPIETPTLDTDIANKKYVDDNIGGGSGDVVGPASATNNAVVTFDGVTGKLCKDSVVTVPSTTTPVLTSDIATKTYVDNVMSPMGEVYWMDELSETVITVVSTPVKATTISSSLGAPGTMHGFSLSGQNRLVYDGTRTQIMHCGCTLSAEAVGPGTRQIHAMLYKNGVLIPGSSVTFVAGNTSNISSSAIHAMTSMSTNDYIELWVSNEIDTQNILVHDANIFAVGMHPFNI